ncbi:MAG: substrate-binding domain-containing protein [Nitrospiraceae bacterium]|nr:MAG: substrate-binding domain-containing protein [Nitrospiraceae bacterium]
MRNITVCIVAVLTILIACSVAAAGETITIFGTGDSQELLRSLARAYEKGYPGTSIRVPDSIGIGGGVRETGLGNCDLGRVARPTKKKEEKYNLSHKAFALSPVVFVANPNVNVDSLAADEINAIFSGKITMRNEVGGHRGRIYVLASSGRGN